MAGETPTKTCPACAQVINAPAKLCPWCRTAQGCWSFLTWQNPWVTVLVVLIVIAGALSVVLTLRKVMLGEGEDYASHRNEINVVESSFHLQEGKNGLEVSVVGVLTNTSSLPWKDVQVEAQLFDADGKLIDSLKDRHFGLAVLPSDAMGFRLLAKAAREEPAYAGHRIFVRFAKDARNHW